MCIQKNLFTILMLAVGLADPLKAMAGIDSMGDWTAPSSITLPGKNGPIQASIQQMNFTWRRSTNQRLEKHPVTAITIPGMDLYWLGYGGSFAPNEKEFFLFNNQIVGASTLRGDGIVFYPSSEHLRSNNPTDEIHEIFHRKLDEFEKKHFNVQDIRMGMEEFLGPFPFTGAASALGEPAPNITKIDVGGDTFTIELAGGQGNAVPATITFDTSFKPIKATLRGKQVFPK